jgi:hypothetical protein
MTKKFVLAIGSLVILLAVAGGAFYGGMLFQQQQTANARVAFFNGRGGTPQPGGDTGGGGGGFFGGGGGGGGGGAGGGGRGGTFGQIKSIDGNTITLSSPQREVKVDITNTTIVRKVVDGTRADLTVGETITVRGTTDTSGNVTADNIQVGGLGGGRPGANATPTP